MSEARARTVADRKLHPENYSRLGVPDGMRKAEAMELWAVARTQADEFMEVLEAQGVVSPGIGHNGGPELLSLETDDEMAKMALRELCVMALGPMECKKTKRGVLNLLLKFTKPLPVAKTAEVMIMPAYDWLMQASAAMASSEATSTAGVASTA
jgi:hypothetical protein